MGVGRVFPAEGGVKVDVQGRAADPLVGAQDVADLHEVVVDDIGQVIGRQAVGLQQDGVGDLAVGHDDLAANAS
jgi:hypothetical protein